MSLSYTLIRNPIAGNLL